MIHNRWTHTNQKKWLLIIHVHFFIKKNSFYKYTCPKENGLLSKRSCKVFFNKELQTKLLQLRLLRSPFTFGHVFKIYYIYIYTYALRVRFIWFELCDSFDLFDLIHLIYLIWCDLFDWFNAVCKLTQVHCVGGGAWLYIHIAGASICTFLIKKSFYKYTCPKEDPNLNLYGTTVDINVDIQIVPYKFKFGSLRSTFISELKNPN